MVDGALESTMLVRRGEVDGIQSVDQAGMPVIGGTKIPHALSESKHACRPRSKSLS